MPRAIPEFEADTEALSSLTDQLSRCVVPLFCVNPSDTGASPEMAGTAFMVRARKTVYMVSAAHVFDQHPLVMYVGDKETLSVHGALVASRVPKGGTRDDDKIDIGVLRLEGVDQPPFVAVGKDCIDVDRLLANQHDRFEKSYMFVGFPETRSRPNRHKRNIESQVHSFRNSSAPAKDYTRAGVSPLTHIVLPYGTKRSYTHGHGVKAPPDPRGFSGSPLFWQPEDWRETAGVRVVGVVVERRPELVVATDIGFALEMILRDLLHLEVSAQAQDS